ncbi:hypothetical protein Lesp02_66770 [Lentzea sp. NBRC 105346]|nr:hypothetical protein Lesp02_66770 [Lentzea sp. NBRC 105346]
MATFTDFRSVKVAITVLGLGGRMSRSALKGTLRASGVPRVPFRALHGVGECRGDVARTR